MTRTFNAPRALVFEAFNKPELVRQWLLGPPGWTMPVCEIDLRVGGSHRYVWRHIKNGNEMGMGGVYREVAPPERIVCHRKIRRVLVPGGAVITFVLTEQAGKPPWLRRSSTTHSKCGKQSSSHPMESGVTAGFNRLEELLESLKAQGARL